jgi:hypothetical protein
MRAPCFGTSHPDALDQAHNVGSKTAAALTLLILLTL